MRVLCLITTIIIVLIALFMCRAQDVWSADWYKPDDIGTITQLSYEMPYIKESETYEHEALRLGLSVGKFIDKSERFKLEGELFIASHHSEPTLVGDYSRSAKEIGFYVIPKYYWHTKHTDIYVGIPLGFSHLMDTEDQPNFADSGLLGTFGLAIGLDTPLKKNLSLRTEYRATHTSDPLGSDAGRNLHGILIGLRYRW